MIGVLSFGTFLLLLITMSEVTKRDDMILSFERYVIYFIFAIALLILSLFIIASRMFHPLLLVLIVVSVAILVQSYKPVREGTGNRLRSFMKWIKERSLW